MRCIRQVPLTAPAATSMASRTRCRGLSRAHASAVIEHPETGRAALYLNPVYTQRIAGWTNSESQGLLQHIYRHAVNENFTWRLRWARGTLAIWDNRATQHFALNDYHGYRREMVRTSVKGSVPKRASR